MARTTRRSRTRPVTFTQSSMLLLAAYIRCRPNRRREGPVPLDEICLAAIEISEKVGKPVKGNRHEALWLGKLNEMVDGDLLWKDERHDHFRLTAEGRRIVRDAKTSMRGGRRELAEKLRFLMNLLDKETRPMARKTKAQLLTENRRLRNQLGEGHRAQPLRRVSSFSTVSSDDLQMEEQPIFAPAEPISPIRNETHFNPANSYPTPQSAPRLARKPTLLQESPSRPPRRQPSMQAGPSHFVDEGGPSVNSRLTSHASQEMVGGGVDFPMDAEEPAGAACEFAECERIRQELTAAKDAFKTLKQENQILENQGQDKGSQMQQMRRDYATLQRKIADLTEELAIARNQNASMERQLREKKAKIKFLDAELPGTQAQLALKDAQLTAMQGRFTSTCATFGVDVLVLHETLRKERREKTEVTARQDESERKLNAMRTEIESVTGKYS